MPSATGENWDKYRKNFADEETPEKKISPLSDKSVQFSFTSSFFFLHLRLFCKGWKADSGAVISKYSRHTVLPRTQQH